MLQIDLQVIGAFAPLASTPLIVLGPILALGYICKDTAFCDRALRGYRGRRRRPTTTPRIRLPVPRSLPAEAQWARVSKIVETTHDNARKACQHHAVAGLKLDAADYAFRRMLEELNSVVARPLVVAALPLPAKGRVFASPVAALAA